jgi:transcriptional regulator with XRE-family HTH domain
MARAIKPAKPLRSAEHRALRGHLVAARRKAGLTQVEAAKRLGKPQSFVAKYEGGERRLDVIEFLAVTKALGADARAIIRDLLKKPL